MSGFSNCQSFSLRNSFYDQKHELSFSGPVYINGYSKCSVFVLSKAHRFHYVHTCTSVFIAFLTVHCKTLENVCMPWFDILVNVRTSEGTESAAFVPFGAGAKLWTNTTLSALFLGLWYGLLVRVLRCEPLERTNVLRMDIFVQMVINKSLNSAILSSKQAIQ